MRNDPRITAELVREYFHYAPDTGLITYAKRRGKALLGAKAGSIKKGYLLLSINGIFVQAARVIWLHVHGKWPEHDIDHVNREKLDNRIANLRDVPPQINSWNLGSERKNNVSGHPGVHFFQRAKRY